MIDHDLILAGHRWRTGVAQMRDLLQNPAATDAGRRAVPTEQPATREALGAEPPATVPCDCSACARGAGRGIRGIRLPVSGDIGKALDAIAVANAIRFAGLNTPDRKQMGAAQAVRTSPFPNATASPPPSAAAVAPAGARVPHARAPAHPFPPPAVKEAHDGQAHEQQAAQQAPPERA